MAEAGSKQSRSAYLVFFAAEAIYIMAIAGRSSFGVAGLYAMDRFAINASTLSLFTVIQLAVYSGAQIPVGLLLDRIGVRKVLVSGAVIMAAGQIVLGLTTSLHVALAARILIGLGDATAFSSVLRLIPVWFTPFAAPLMTQMTGMLGQIGQIISSIPFAFVLGQFGWSPAFVGLGTVAGLVSIIGLVWVRNSPTDSGQQVRRVDPQEQGQSARDVMREPGTWLGFWTHFTCGFPATVFLLLWGTPFLQISQGLSAGTAAGLLILPPLAGAVVGPVIGRMTGAHPLRRSWLVYGSVGLCVATWIPLLVMDSALPLWYLALFCALLSIPSSASSIAFDFVRTSVDVRRIGTGNGLANMGGFSASLIISWVIGRILDQLAPGGDYSRDDFQIAMASQVIFIVIGLIGIAYFKNKVRKKMMQQGIIVPPLREVWERYHPAATVLDSRTTTYEAAVEASSMELAAALAADTVIEAENAAQVKAVSDGYGHDDAAGAAPHTVGLPEESGTSVDHN